MPQIVERVKTIEALGFDAVWFGDLQRICREVYVEMTACALNTSRITLGIGVTMPTTRHASVTASAFASLHDLAPGRIRAGISTGDSGVRSIGRRPESIASLESYIRQVKGLLQNQVVDFDEGGKAKLSWLQAPTNVPIYVAATGPRLTHAAGRMADGAILLRERDPAQMAVGIQMFKEAAASAGKAPADTKLSCWLQTCLGPDRTLARRKLNGPVGVIINMSNPALFDEEDLPLIARLKANYNPSKHSRSYVSDEFRIPDKYIDRFALGGDREDAISCIKQLSTVEGLDEIILAPQHIPEIPGPTVDETIRYFAEEVLPSSLAPSSSVRAGNYACPKAPSGSQEWNRRGALSNATNV